MLSGVSIFAINNVGNNASELFETVNNAFQTSGNENENPAPIPPDEKPMPPEVTGISWAIKGITEPMNCDTNIADPDSKTAYDRYSADEPNGTLIIYPRNGISGTLPNFVDVNGAPWFGDSANVLEITVYPGVQANQQACFLFSGLYNCTSMDLSGLDTSQVTNMENMFEGCLKIDSIDVSGFDTSKAENISDLFYYCTNLASIDVSGFDTSNVKDIDRSSVVVPA